MRGLGLPSSCVLRAWRRLFSCKDSWEMLPTFPNSAPPSYSPLLPSVLSFVHFQLILH